MRNERECDSIFQPSAGSVGLCFSCQQSRQVRTDRGSVYYQCQLAASDPRYPKYPRLPVLRCPGFELKTSAQPGDIVES